MSQLILALLLLLPSLAWSAGIWLSCPYEGGRVSIDRFSTDICIERGFLATQCGQINKEPWAEQEVDDGAGGRAAVVYTNVSVAIQPTLVAAQPVGAGCRLLNRATLDADLARPQAARTTLRQRRTSDNVDINPVRSRTLIDLQDRVENTRTASLLEDFIFYAQNFMIGTAWALGTFPDHTVLIDDFNRADENPLSGGGAWTQFDIDGNTGDLQILSNQVARATSNGSAAYTAKTCPADCDAYFTIVVVGTSRVFVRLADLGNNGDGYLARGISTGNVNVYRVDNGTTTQLGATCTQAVSGGDELGVRAEGSNITSYLNNTAICTRSDSTYSAAGFAGIQTSNSGDRLDDFFMTVVSGRKQGWWYPQ